MKRRLNGWAAVCAVCCGFAIMAFMFLWNWQSFAAILAFALLTYIIDLYDRGTLNDLFK
jgi:hypothetical protein